MHPFLYPELVDAIHDERIRYRQAGKRFRHQDASSERRRDTDC